MAKQERTRKSSPANKVKSFVVANEQLLPTSDLDYRESERFDAIISSREHSTWLPADIHAATELAKTIAERDALRDQYMEEGAFVRNRFDDEVPSAKFLMWQTLDTQIIKTRRDLGLSASQRGVSGHKQAKRNQQDASAADKISSLSSLIARPK